MMVRNATFSLVVAVCMAGGAVAADTDLNLFTQSTVETVVLVAPDQPDDLERYALAELARHVEKTTGTEPKLFKSADIEGGGLPADSNVVILGRTDDNPDLKDLAEGGFFEPNTDQQGYSLRIDVNPDDPQRKRWLAALCGADSHGVLYAVRDFAHYYFYRESGRTVLRPAELSIAPVIKVRQLSESGCNLFSAENPHDGFMFTAHFNRDTQSATFDKHHYIDWLSEWKINTISLLWCNYPAYDEAYADCVRYAHSRGIRVVAFFCPFRPGHEKPPGDSLEAAREGGADCPRDPRNREWYFHRIAELITREPQVDGIALETPEHDGIRCDCPECKKNPYPGIKMLNELVEEIRRHRPDLPISFSLKEPTPSPQAARKVADRLVELAGPADWYSNSYRSRADRVHWHDLGPKYGTYLRPFRSRLRSKESASVEIDGVFSDYRLAAERGVLGYGFCYRFYGGKLGSHTVHQDAEMRRKFPHRQGPFSLALLGEAAFDPFVAGEDRAGKIRRIRDLTIPDYPGGRSLTDEDIDALGGHPGAPPEGAGSTTPRFRFQKTNRPVLQNGAAGKFDSTHAKYPCVLKVGDEWWMWYNGRSDDAFTGSVGLATSRDGLVWTKKNNGDPVLEHGPPGTFDSTKVDHPAVVFFEDRFHMWYTAGDSGSVYKIGYATSEDGIDWTRENDARPVLRPGAQGKFDDRVVLHPAVVRDEAGLLHMWYNGVGPQESFRVGHATSRDGVRWERQNGGDPVLEPSEVAGREEKYVYNVMVLLGGGTYHMWYSSALDIDNRGRYKPKGNAIVYARSEDGTQWTKDAVPTLVNGDPGSIDAYACFACYVVPRSDGLWMYYSSGSRYQRYTTALATSKARLPCSGPASHPARSKLFRYQWGVKHPGFLLGQICADLDNDGRREIFYSSRGTKQTLLLSAADGTPR